MIGRYSKQSESIYAALLFFILPLFVLGWTMVPVAFEYMWHVWVIIACVGVFLLFSDRDEYALAKTSVVALLILIPIGATQWFLSPFFFLLYLFPIYLAFIYTPLVAFGFIAALFVLFGMSIQQGLDIRYNVITLASLIAIFPLIIYLRRRYLIISQEGRDILILNQDVLGEGGEVGTIEKLLSNKVTNIGVSVRQQLSFIRQAATALLEDDVSPSDHKEYLTRIRDAAGKAMHSVRTFEGETSGNSVLTNHRNNKE